MPGFLDAAYRLLKEFERPMSCQELTQVAISRGLLRTRGLTPVATMASLLYSDIKKNGVNSRFVKICKGHYILRDQVDTLPLTITQPVDKKLHRNHHSAEIKSEPNVAYKIHDLVDREIRLIEDFLRGVAQPLSGEKICDWVTLCYTLELYSEGAELFSYVDPAEVNEWYYARTKKIARLCKIHQENLSEEAGRSDA